jgi:hypothetical protein
MIAMTACMPPPALSAMVAPGIGATPSARGPEQARKPATAN